MIPAFESGANHLPHDIHLATLDEVEDRFVRAAPFSDRRKLVFDAFRVWYGVVSGMLPNARFWVNGGFVTHKEWSAPKDVDVVVLVKQDDLNSLSAEQSETLDSMITAIEPVRVQPMSGMVDAFVFVRGNVGETVFWRDWWSALSDENKKPIPGAQKGFLEVRP